MFSTTHVSETQICTVNYTMYTHTLHTYIHTYIHTYRQTDRQAGRPTDRCIGYIRVRNATHVRPFDSVCILTWPLNMAG